MVTADRLRIKKNVDFHRSRIASRAGSAFRGFDGHASFAIRDPNARPDPAYKSRPSLAGRNPISVNSNFMSSHTSRFAVGFRNKYAG
jgi:hypothetical protein